MNEVILAISAVLIAALIGVFVIARKRGIKDRKEIRRVIDQAIRKLAAESDSAGEEYNIIDICGLFGNKSAMIEIGNDTIVLMKIKALGKHQFECESLDILKKDG